MGERIAALALIGFCACYVVGVGLWLVTEAYGAGDSKGKPDDHG